MWTPPDLEISQAALVWVSKIVNSLSDISNRTWVLGEGEVIYLRNLQAGHSSVLQYSTIYKDEHVLFLIKVFGSTSATFLLKCQKTIWGETIMFGTLWERNDKLDSSAIQWLCYRCELRVFGSLYLAWLEFYDETSNVGQHIWRANLSFLYFWFQRTLSDW